jgi:hypothetical protein
MVPPFDVSVEVKHQLHGIGKKIGNHATTNQDLGFHPHKVDTIVTRRPSRQQGMTR